MSEGEERTGTSMGRRKIFRLRTELREQDESATGAVAINEPVISVTRGSFTFAVCDGCGWEGPGRRSHSTMLTDLSKHAAKCGKGSLARQIP